MRAMMASTSIALGPGLSPPTIIPPFAPGDTVSPVAFAAFALAAPSAPCPALWTRTDSSRRACRMRCLRSQRPRQRHVERMAGAHGDDGRGEFRAEQGEIAQEIQDLVPRRLVFEAGRVQ